MNNIKVCVAEDPEMPYSFMASHALLLNTYGAVLTRYKDMSHIIPVYRYISTIIMHSTPELPSPLSSETAE